MFSVSELEVGGLPALTFEVAAGRVLAVSGPSGAGKTRLLRALADLDPAPGRVAWDGVERTGMPAPQWRRRVGLLPAEPRFWERSVRGHFPAGASGLEAGFRELGLDPGRLDDDPARLSTGERSRVAVLRLLARRPRVLLLDEPTANLDADAAARVVRLLTRSLRQRPAAAIWVSHRPEEVRGADQVLCLPGGELAEGSMEAAP